MDLQEIGMNIVDEPQSLSAFMVYGLVRAIQHPKILFQTPPIQAVKAYLAIRRHSHSDIQQLLQNVFGVDHTTYLQLLNENTLPKTLYRYPSRILLYMLVRITKPTYVVETGVGGGYASAHILEALRLNNHGYLYSIDYHRTYDPSYYALEPGLPCGGVVPQYLRSRWTVSMESSQQELPKLLPRLGKIDMFIHDSLHTRDCAMYEYGLAWKYLKLGGLLVSHDIWAPWLDFLRIYNRSYVAYQSYGIAIK
ncbi:MAG: class I SAM-dependent methyltransferase [Nitrososphaerales archaeon]